MRHCTKVECWEFKEDFEASIEADEIEIWSIFNMAAEYEYDTFKDYEIIRVTACLENSQRQIIELDRLYYIDNTIRK